jgi:hypothetical protein
MQAHRHRDAKKQRGELTNDLFLTKEIKLKQEVNLHLS